MTESKEKRLIIYTDASVDQTVGIGAFAIQVYEDNVLIDTYIRTMGSQKEKVTSNICELSAVCFALTLYPHNEVTICSDSQYVVNGLLKVHNITSHTWLWNIVERLYQRSRVQISHVTAHSTNEKNNAVDKLARNAMREYRKLIYGK